MPPELLNRLAQAVASYRDNRDQSKVSMGVIIGVAAALVVVLVAGLLFVLLRKPEPGGGTIERQVYYMNVATGDLFKAGSSEVPPIQTSAFGDAEGVRAYVFGCGNCKSTFIGYVEKWTPEGKVAMEQVMELGGPEVVPMHRMESMNAVKTGKLVAVPVEGGGELEWIAAHEPAGLELIEQAGKRNCIAAPPRPCDP